jgi:hypothetical protein
MALFLRSKPDIWQSDYEPGLALLFPRLGSLEEAIHRCEGPGSDDGARHALFVGQGSRS